MKNFLDLLWNTIGNPWFWVISIVSILIIFFLFRRILKWIPLVILVAFGMVIGSLLPSFILQYHHELSGVVVGIEISIEDLKMDPIEDHSKSITRLEKSLVYYQELLEKFDNASGFEMYKTFFTNIQKRVYQETLERYSPALVFNSYGFIGIGIGAGIGFLLWIILKIIFRKRKSKNKK